MANNALKISQCEYHKIFKVCLAIFQHYAWKDYTDINRHFNISMRPFTKSAMWELMLGPNDSYRLRTAFENFCANPLSSRSLPTSFKPNTPFNDVIGSPIAVSKETRSDAFWNILAKHLPELQFDALYATRKRQQKKTTRWVYTYRNFPYKAVLYLMNLCRVICPSSKFILKVQQIIYIIKTMLVVNQFLKG